MAVVALVLYAVWLTVAFGVRTVIHQRRTGDSGWRRPDVEPGSAAWWATVTFSAALLIGVAAPIAALAGVPPVGFLDTPAIAVTGIAVTVAGIVATIGAQASMGGAWRIGVDDDETTQLVTGGPFSLVRNPIFTAMVTAAAGLTMIVPNVVAIAGLAALIVGVDLQVRCVEEPYLARTHQGRYTAYAATTGRFVPGLGRLHLAGPARAHHPTTRR